MLASKDGLKVYDLDVKEYLTCVEWMGRNIIHALALAELAEEGAPDLEEFEADVKAGLGTVGADLRYGIEWTVERGYAEILPTMSTSKNRLRLVPQSERFNGLSHTEHSQQLHRLAQAIPEELRSPEMQAWAAMSQTQVDKED